MKKNSQISNVTSKTNSDTEERRKKDKIVTTPPLDETVDAQGNLFVKAEVE